MNEKVAQALQKGKEIAVPLCAKGKEMALRGYAKGNELMDKVSFLQKPLHKKIVWGVLGVAVLMALSSFWGGKSDYSDPRDFVAHMVKMDLDERSYMWDKYGVKGFEILNVKRKPSRLSGYEDTISAKVRIKIKEECYIVKDIPSVYLRKISASEMTFSDDFKQDEANSLNKEIEKWSKDNKVCKLYVASSSDIESATTYELEFERRKENGVFVAAQTIAQLLGDDAGENKDGEINTLTIQTKKSFPGWHMVFCKNPEGDLTEVDQTWILKWNTIQTEMNDLVDTINHAAHELWCDTENDEEAAWKVLYSFSAMQLFKYNYEMLGTIRDKMRNLEERIAKEKATEEAEASSGAVAANDNIERHIAMQQGKKIDPAAMRREQHAKNIARMQKRYDKVKSLYDEKVAWMRDARKKHRQKNEEELKKSISRLRNLLECKIAKYDTDYQELLSTNGENHDWKSKNDTARRDAGWKSSQEFEALRRKDNEVLTEELGDL